MSVDTISLCKGVFNDTLSCRNYILPDFYMQEIKKKNYGYEGLTSTVMLLTLASTVLGQHKNNGCITFGATLTCVCAYMYLWKKEISFLISLYKLLMKNRISFWIGANLLCHLPNKTMSAANSSRDIWDKKQLHLSHFKGCPWHCWETIRRNWRLPNQLIE